MSRETPAGGNLQMVHESRRQALGRFLRERREAVVPEDVGISSRRGRRTPGLRREEVAFLADIGVKWYARLEAGDEIHPSEVTLMGIAVALKLSPAELEYMLDLAGLRQSLLAAEEVKSAMPEPISALLVNFRGVAATVGDRILTPLRWNALGDAIYGHSKHDDPVERNGLVRSLFDAEFIDFLGAEREELVFRAVGMLRLNGSSQYPSPLMDAVYERVKGDALFERAWDRRVIAGELSSERPMVRHHPIVGKLFVFAIDCSIPMRPDLFLRTLAPADSETAAKFERLESSAIRDRYPGAPSLALVQL